MVHLPDELVEQIVSYLQPPFPFAALARCSRPFYRICTPIIYQHIHLHQFSTDYGEHAPDRLRNLTTLLLHRSDLASCVESFSLHPQWLSQDDELPGSLNIDDVLTATFEQTADTATSAEDRKGVTQSPGEKDSLLALLLPRLPNLKRLDLAVPNESGLYYGDWLRAVCVPSAQTQRCEDVLLIGQRPRNLRSLLGHFASWNRRKDPSTRSVAPHAPLTQHIMPHIRALRPKRLLLYDMGDFPGDYSKYTPSLSHVREAHSRRKHGKMMTYPINHLEIRRAGFKAESALSLISTCDKLKTFIYEYRPTRNISASDIIWYLTLHADTLTHVWIDIIPRPDSQGTLIGPLSALINVQHLKVASTLLFSRDFDQDKPDDGVWTALMDTLPANITRLGIVKAEYRRRSLTAALFTYLHMWRRVTPQLKVLEIEGHFGDLELDSLVEFYSLMAKYSEIAQSTGLDFRVVENADTGFPGVDLASAGTERGWGMEEDVHWPASVGEEKKRRLLLDLATFRAFR